MDLVSYSMLQEMSHYVLVATGVDFVFVMERIWTCRLHKFKFKLSIKSLYDNIVIKDFYFLDDDVS